MKANSATGNPTAPALSRKATKSFGARGRMDVCRVARGGPRSAFHYPPVDDNVRGEWSKGENNESAILSDCLVLCCFNDCLHAASYNGSRQERQELPDGTTMPLGKLQENLRLGKGLPISGTLNLPITGAPRAARCRLRRRVFSDRRQPR